MADVTYRIIVEDATVEGGAAGGTGSTSGGGSTPSDMGWLGNVYNTYKAIKGFAPVAAAGSIGKNLFMWQASLVGRNTGSSLVQEKINFGMQIAGQTLTEGGMLMGGIATGNPLLVLGGAVSAVNTVIGYAKEREQFNYDRRWESIGLTYARERAGASYNRSRLE